MAKNKKDKRAIWLERSCLKIISIGTFLILFTPLIINTRFFFPFVGPKSLYFMGLAELIFFSWFFLITFSQKYRPHFNLVLVGIVLFLIAFIASSVLGIDLFYSFWSKFERMTGVLMMLHLPAFFLVISSTFEEEDWRKIFTVSLFVGIIISLIALTSDNPSMRGGSTIGNDSFMGTYLIFNLFLALYLIFKDEFRIYSAVCFFMMALALFLSGARAAQLSFLGGLILFFFLWLAFRENKKIRIVSIFLLFLSLVAVIYLGVSSFQPESFVRKQVVERIVGETFGGRFIVWQKGWESFLERPLLGWGPENFEFAFTKKYDPCFGTSRCGGDIWYDRAHNIIFDTLVSLGISGVITYLAIFIFTFYALWKNYFQRNFDLWLSGTFTVLLISYSVQNLTVFDMISSYMVFFLVLGFIARMTKKEALEIETKPITLINLVLGILIFSAFLISFYKFVFLPLRTDRYAISALRAEPFSEERLSFYKKTLESSPVGRYQIREFFADTSLESLSEDAQRERIIEEFDFLAQELEQSARENSSNFRSYLKLGQLYNTYSRVDLSKIQDAERVLEKTIELSPKNQQGYWALAQTKLYQGKPNEALVLAEQALELEPQLQRSHLIVIEVAKMMRDLELAEKKIEEAIEINPAWEKDLRGI
jgi:O-antigen ligase